MIPTKTYPLYAIMGKEIEEEYERGYAQGCEEGKERIAELEAELMMRREQAEGLQNQWVKDTQKIVALEVEAEKLRKDAERYRWLRAKHWHDGGLCVVTNAKETVRFGTDCPSHERLDAAIDAAREGE